MFARHLPPSAGTPRVLALDAQAAAELAEAAEVVQASEPAGGPPGPYDAVAGRLPPERLPSLAGLLRPGGRLILAAEAEPPALLAALEAAGYIHCLVEAVFDQAAGPASEPLCLYRGERPPHGSSLERHHTLAGALPTAAVPSLPAGATGTAQATGTAADIDATLVNPGDLAEQRQVRHLFLLITQRPNKPAWKLQPGERLEWHAATLLHPASGQTRLLAFSSLVKAVAFMQRAILAGAIADVNKVGKFPLAAARAWRHPMLLNLDYDSAASARPGPPLPVDPLTALTGEE